MAKGSLTAWLRSRGWERNAGSWVPECGEVSDRADGTGWCQRPARWEKSGRALCAQHAQMCEKTGV